MSTQKAFDPTVLTRLPIGRLLLEDDRLAIIIPCHQMMRPQQGGWKILPFSLVLRRRAIEALPTFFNVTKNESEVHVDPAEIVEAYMNALGDRRYAEAVKVRYEKLGELLDFMVCNRPLINFVLGFHGRVALSGQEVGDSEFGIARRGGTGGRYLIALAAPEVLFEEKLVFFVRLEEIPVFYRHAPKLLKMPPHYRVHTIAADVIRRVKAESSFDNAIHTLIYETVGRVASNAVFILGIDVSKKFDEPGRSFLVPARRVASMPFLDALEGAEIITAEDASACIIVMRFSSADIGKIQMITDDELLGRKEVDAAKKAIINRKIAMTWYGAITQQASIQELMLYEELLTGGAVATAEETSAGTAPAKTEETAGAGSEEELLPTPPERESV